MSTDLNRKSEMPIRYEEIQSKCACQRLEAKECYRARYPAPIDDFARADWEQEMEDGDSYCECSCHSEISEEFQDEDDL